LEQVGGAEVLIETVNAYASATTDMDSHQNPREIPVIGILALGGLGVEGRAGGPANDLPGPGAARLHRVIKVFVGAEIDRAEILNQIPKYFVFLRILIQAVCLVLIPGIKPGFCLISG
jgi:hypothetical protein